jgi:Protein of unknown function (DUF1569)
MPAPIDTAKVTGRRQLHFKSLGDIAADVESLEKAKEIRALGNWSAGQIFKHVTIVMNGSLDGTAYRAPVLLRFFVRLLFKRKFLTGPMSAGFTLPASAAELLPPPTTREEGIQGIRQALTRLQSEPQRAPHPVLGALTREEWDQLHCRHCELHLSFLVPGG